MKHTLWIALLIALLAPVSVPVARADVSLAVTVGQPGFYGTLVLGDHYPPPVLVYAEPIIIDHYHTPGRPLYLHVPPGHAKDWRKHCKHYNACGAPVYFVQDSWYNDVYVPSYQVQHGNPGKGNKGKGQGKNNKGNKGKG